MILSLTRLGAIALLLAATPLANAANLLMIEHDVSVDQGFGAMVSDRFTWTDTGGQPRVGVLAHNDGQTGPNGTRGGELREFRYQTPGGTRIVRASGSAAAGFGYVVSHNMTEANCTGGGDSSSLGHFTTGQFTRVFEGRHHAIFRFTQNYPRYCTKDPPAAEHDLPVTVDWVFSTGWDNPLWAVSWDLSGVNVNVLEDDSRAPYGELLFDGATTEAGHSVIAGVGWGDRFKFFSTDTPVTYDSNWTWNAANTIPYAKLWTTGVDATMGTVQTQTIIQQDAGGYFGTDRWNTTSGDGNACAANDEFAGSSAHLMPCSFNWPYQLINYSFGEAIGGNNADQTNNTRLAWGTNFGFLGQSQYPIQGSSLLGGPLTGDPTASGYPKKSYSTFVVLGRHSDGPVEAQVTQIERVQTTALTATIGSVLTTGAAGVNRTDTVPYAPAGWNHVYAAWALQAAGNQIDANFNVGSGSLTNPLMIVSSWTANALPSTVRLSGTTLIQDTDYFPSLRAGAQELWITLNRNLTGSTNRLEILAPTATGNLVVTASVSPTTSFSIGDTLLGRAGADNPGLPKTVDFYIGIVLPDGDTIAFITPAGFVFGRLSSLGTAPAFAAGVSLAAPFTVSPASVVTHTWAGFEPHGQYVFFVAAVTAGAFADGRLDPGDLVALATAGFSF